MVDIEDYQVHSNDFHSFTEDEMLVVTDKIISWYRLNRRKLPWRGDQPPYSKTANVKTSSKRDSKQASMNSFFASKIQKVEREEKHEEFSFVKEGITSYTEYVSEIMLQQTRVDTVIDKYIQWMIRFPTIEALSKATEEEVNALWSGLGYYRRAQYLLKGARYIMDHHNGIIPNKKDDLLKVPGVGEYTAGAILSIAFDKPEAAVDGNVMRVLSRLRTVYQIKTQKEFVTWCWKTAALLVSTESPSDYTQGIMELGAVICTPAQPSCKTCPLRDYCKTYSIVQKHKKEAESDDIVENENCSICCSFPKQLSTVEVFPMATQSKEVPIERYAALLIEDNTKPGSFLLHKRKAAILTNQLEPFLFQIPQETNEESISDVVLDVVKVWMKSSFPATLTSDLIIFHGTTKHIFSHRIHLLSVCSVKIDLVVPMIDDYEWWSPQRILEFGTTTWLLLMLKTAERPTLLLKNN